MIHLEPCPFCGQELEQQHRKYNPFARCVTPDCMGGKLPLISLDLPRDIERWNHRGREQALAAHVDIINEWLRAVARDFDTPEQTVLVGQDANRFLAMTPATYLARRDLVKQAEALDAEADAISGENAYHITVRAEMAGRLRDRAADLLRQAAGGEPNDD